MRSATCRHVALGAAGAMAAVLVGCGEPTVTPGEPGPGAGIDAGRDTAATPGTGGTPAPGAGGGGGSGGGPGGRPDGGGGAGDTGTGTPPRTEDGGVSPSMIALTALGANGTVGLDWSRVAGATGYKLYWSTTGGVTPQTGQAITVGPNPSAVHRELTNGMTYTYVVAAVTAAGEGPPSPPAMARPGGEWTLEELGSGDFDDVVTGARVPRLPIDKRIHILLLAEGYLAAELPVFHEHAKHNLETPTNDVDRWIREVFGLDPYSKFREGFVIWTLPRASTTHSDGGSSAFGVGAPTAAAPLWAALDGEGPDAFPFPPAAASRNFVAAFLLLDPARGRAGVSGHSTSCRHPTMTNLTMRCNFGVGHAHEFTHSFAEVRDEYLENSNGVPGAIEWSNVAPSNQCAQLPWQHLLAGRGINTTEQLVGAFGRAERGFHSEFKCHMNGTHDNGEYWCAPGESLTLRPNWFCNYCRELTVFRLFYRTGLIPGANAAAFANWKAMYRTPFYTRFGFQKPAVVPQTVMCTGQAAKPVYEACTP